MRLAVRFLFLCVLFLILFSCRDGSKVISMDEEISADSLISPEKMVLVLADVHVIEAALLLERNASGGSPDKQALYQGLYVKFHITPGRLDQSLTYYRRKPDVYVKMYDKVIEILEQRKKNVTGSK